MPLLLYASTLNISAKGSELRTLEEPRIGVVLVLTTTVKNSVVIPKIVNIVVRTKEI
jgi:hypothetical protein